MANIWSRYSAFKQHAVMGILFLLASEAFGSNDIKWLFSLADKNDDWASKVVKADPDQAIVRVKIPLNNDFSILAFTDSPDHYYKNVTYDNPTDQQDIATIVKAINAGKADDCDTPPCAKQNLNGSVTFSHGLNFVNKVMEVSFVDMDKAAGFFYIDLWVSEMSGLLPDLANNPGCYNFYNGSPIYVDNSPDYSVSDCINLVSMTIDNIWGDIGGALNQMGTAILQGGTQIVTGGQDTYCCNMPFPKNQCYLCVSGTEDYCVTPSYDSPEQVASTLAACGKITPQQQQEIIDVGAQGWSAVMDTQNLADLLIDNIGQDTIDALGWAE